MKHLLQTSSDGHFFKDARGEPFFLLADTAWLLFNKLREEEIRELFADRAGKGFTVILAVVFRDLFEPNSPNAYGVRPFASEEDLFAVRMNPEWMAYVRDITGIAAEYGLTMGLLPTWGDKWNTHSNSAGPVIMDAPAARRYGTFLSDSLADFENLIWILGGDSPIRTQAEADIVHAMARGLRDGGSGERLITFHPCHDQCSDIFHASGWLDFNVIQSGHVQPNIADYGQIERLFHTRPAKPCLNLEANFEDCPMFLMQPEEDRPPREPLFSACDVRKCFYRSVLAGGAGFAYGCEPVRQIYREGDRVHVYAHYRMPSWREGLRAPGSSQLRLLPDLLRQRPGFSRVPAQDLLLPITNFWGVGMDFSIRRNDDPVSHVRVARCREGSCIMAYLPVRQAIRIDTRSLSGKAFTVSAYDPESGDLSGQYRYANGGCFTFVPERDLDTLVVLDAG